MQSFGTLGGRKIYDTRNPREVRRMMLLIVFRDFKAISQHREEFLVISGKYGQEALIHGIVEFLANE